jgi:hypothetical protein
VLLSRLALVCWLALLSAGACGDSSTVSDGSVDSGLDARLDTGPDSGDTGRDTAVIDSGRDTTVEPTTWVALEGIPGGCVIERAENPETVYPNAWEPCPDAPEGCIRLADTPGRLRAADSGGDFLGGVGYFSLVVGEGIGPDYPRIVTVAATDGRVFGAWRAPGFDGSTICQTGPLAMSSGVTAGVHSVRWDADMTLDTIFRSPMGELSVSSTTYATLDSSALPGSNMIQRVAVSEVGLAAEVQPGGFILYFEGESQRRLSGLTSPVPGLPQAVQLVGGHVLWQAWGSTVRVAHASLTDPEEVFIEVDGGDLRGFAADEEWMAWQQLYDLQPDGTFGRVELWASPYARQPADLRPTLVTTLVNREPQARMGEGTYGFLSSRTPNRYTFIRLADGERRILESEAFGGFADSPVALSATAVMVRGTHDGTSELRVYQLDSLPLE